MELKPGYKLTEVGVIPEDWDAKSLESLVTLLTNGFVGTATKSYTNTDEGILYIQGYNVQENGFNLHGIKRVSREFAARNKKSCLQIGDLLTIQTGDIGTTTIVPPELAGANCHALIITRFKRKASEPGYYCQYFNSAQGRSAFKQIETGTTMKHLNGGDMKRLLVPCPPAEEQHAIATTLSGIDAYIAELDLSVTKKQGVKQATMQELLTGKRRLPGFEGQWEVKKLGDLGEIKSGGTPSTSQPAFWDGGIPWCTPTDITALDGRKYLTTTARTISPAGLQGSSAETIPPYSLIMTTRATIGECAINVFPMTTNQGFKNIIPNSSVGTEFLYYLMTTQKQRLVSLCGGSTFLEIGKKELNAYEIRLPLNRDEQDAIASMLSGMDEELQALEANLAKVGNLKQGIMQQLLTGKIRLK